MGDGDYDSIGEIEMDVLRETGLSESSTLLDFGCGNGRLAIHAVPFLHRGSYVGVDISQTFLGHAARRLKDTTPAGCVVRLQHQIDVDFQLEDNSIDIACAFSVFTHMDHEDMYRYLVALRRVIRPGGQLVLSCLPLDEPPARNVFLSEAGVDPINRWQRVRNVVTTRDFVDLIADLAGWSIEKWLPGTAPQATSAAGEQRSLGQAIVILSN